MTPFSPVGEAPPELLFDRLERLDDPPQFVGGFRFAGPFKILGQAFGYLGRGVEDVVEDPPHHDISGEGRAQKDQNEDGDVAFSQEVVAQAEVEKSEKGYEEEKGEDDGQPIVEPLAFQGEIKQLFPEIHPDISWLSFKFSVILTDPKEKKQKIDVSGHSLDFRSWCLIILS